LHGEFRCANLRRKQQSDACRNDGFACGQQCAIFATGNPDLVTAVATSNESVINDTTAAGGTIHTFTLKGSKCVSVPAGRINLVVATPKGNKTTIPIDVKNNL
jgi:hypothetical protein